MFDNNINEEEIEIIDFEDTNNIQNPNNKKINELIDIKNKVIIQGQYPNKQVSYDPNNNAYILSEEGFEDMYVSVIQNNGIYQIIPIDVNTTNDSMNTSNESSNKSNTISHQKTLGTHPGVGNHFHFGEDSGFMNALFFIFLTGLSTGVVFMIILNFFIK